MDFHLRITLAFFNLDPITLCKLIKETDVNNNFWNCSSIEGAAEQAAMEAHRAIKYHHCMLIKGVYFWEYNNGSSL